MNLPTAYRRINKLLWLNRLPNTTITVVENETMPQCLGMTLQDRDFVKPLILVNAEAPNKGRTLIHEMLHVAEPHLPHGRTFELLVNSYWRFARKNIKGLDRL